MFGYFITKQGFSLQLQANSCRKKEGNEERKKDRQTEKQKEGKKERKKEREKEIWIFHELNLKKYR
jgi:hypothetical protein